MSEPNPRDLLARILEDNPDADRADLRRLFFEAVDPDLLSEGQVSGYLARILNDVFDDLYTQLTKRPGAAGPGAAG